MVNPKDFKPHGRPYSSAIRAGNTLYVSGQGSQNSDGKLSENFEERVRQCLLNVRAILQGGGMDFANLVSVHVYLTDLNTVRTDEQDLLANDGRQPSSSYRAGCRRFAWLGTRLRSTPSQLPTQERNELFGRAVGRDRDKPIHQQSKRANFFTFRFGCKGRKPIRSLYRTGEGGSGQCRNRIGRCGHVAQERSCG